jgi:hypothetical protein
MLIWAVLLCAVLCLGVVLVIFLWPNGRPTNSVRFWIYAVGYPVLAWAFLLSGYVGYSYLQISQAFATNRARDDIEDASHALASEPRALLGHAWCFSCDDQENGAQGIVNGALRLEPRPGGVDPSFDVSARWLQIPDHPFYPGNELTEHARHRVVCGWLLERLVEQIGSGLAKLPARTFLNVDLCIESLADLAELRTRLEGLILAKAPTVQVKINASREHMSLFSVDMWHDRLQHREAQLLVSLRLCNAVSERLPDGIGEAGVAILLGQGRTANSRLTNLPSLQLHRPAIGGPDAVKQTVELGVRWGQAGESQIKTIWNHALSEDLVRSVKSDFGDGALWVHIDKTIGNCAGAGEWLATALAAEHALRTGEPQLVLSQQDSDMIALVCRTQA